MKRDLISFFGFHFKLVMDNGIVMSMKITKTIGFFYPNNNKCKPISKFR
jgi:hypothetical protein